MELRIVVTASSRLSVEWHRTSIPWPDYIIGEPRGAMAGVRPEVLGLDAIEHATGPGVE